MCFTAASNLNPQTTLQHFRRPYMLDIFQAAFFVRLLMSVNNNLLHLPNFLRGDLDVEGILDCFFGCGGEFYLSSSINAAAR